MRKLTQVINGRAFNKRLSTKKNVNYRRAFILCNKVPFILVHFGDLVLKNFFKHSEVLNELLPKILPSGVL